MSSNILDYIKNTNKSLKPKSLLIMLYDLMFYIFASAGIFWYYGRLLSTANLLQSPELMALATAPTSMDVDASYNILSRFYVQFFGYSLLIIAFLIIIWAISRYLIWQNITGKEFSMKSMLKFIPANALWIIIMLIPVIIIFLPYYNHISLYGAVPLSKSLSIMRLLFIPLFILIFYLTDLMHIFYLRTGRSFRSMMDSFRTGAMKAYPLFVVYISMLVIISIISLPFSGFYWNIFYFLITIVGFSWVKFFFNTVIEWKSDKKS